MMDINVSILRTVLVPTRTYGIRYEVFIFVFVFIILICCVCISGKYSLDYTIRYSVKCSFSIISLDQFGRRMMVVSTVSVLVVIPIVLLKHVT